MPLARGPFDLEWAGNTLASIETVKTNYAVKTDDHESVQGYTYTLEGAHKVSIELTFLESDTASLGAVLPQYLVPNGGVLSTGETVTDPNGVIDIVPGINSVSDPHSLIITSAGNPGQVLRMTNATSQISGVDTSSTLRTVNVLFTGQPVAGEATLQFFKEGAISNVS